MVVFLGLVGRGRAEEGCERGCERRRKRGGDRTVRDPGRTSAGATTRHRRRSARMTRRRPREATMGIGMVRRSIARARLRRAITVLSSRHRKEGPPTDRAPSHRVSAFSIQVSTGERPGDTAPRAWATQTPRGHACARPKDVIRTLAPIRAPLDAGQRAPCDPTAARVKAPRGSSA